ncbi:unnamed protein product [Acanthosepion pharaonis]|uniref:Uncharacterized protein n=1 Tax=Acanthosepion pharaonis TaxID=158019 RepID=A0A812BAA6_ACAPH|nr:unnamed protein product [Sepia pharaonis]
MFLNHVLRKLLFFYSFSINMHSTYRVFIWQLNIADSGQLLIHFLFPLSHSFIFIIHTLIFIPFLPLSQKFFFSFSFNANTLPFFHRFLSSMFRLFSSFCFSLLLLFFFVTLEHSFIFFFISLTDIDFLLPLSHSFFFFFPSLTFIHFHLPHSHIHPFSSSPLSVFFLFIFLSLTFDLFLPLSHIRPFFLPLPHVRSFSSSSLSHSSFSSSSLFHSLFFFFLSLSHTRCFSSSSLSLSLSLTFVPFSSFLLQSLLLLFPSLSISLTHSLLLSLSLSLFLSLSLSRPLLYFFHSLMFALFLLPHSHIRPFLPLLSFIRCFSSSFLSLTLVAFHLPLSLTFVPFSSFLLQSLLLLFPSLSISLSRIHCSSLSLSFSPDLCFTSSTPSCSFLIFFLFFRLSFLFFSIYLTNCICFSSFFLPTQYICFHVSFLLLTFFSSFLHPATNSHFLSNFIYLSFPGLFPLSFVYSIYFSFHKFPSLIHSLSPPSFLSFCYFLHHILLFISFSILLFTFLFFIQTKSSPLQHFLLFYLSFHFLSFFPLPYIFCLHHGIVFFFLFIQQPLFIFFFFFLRLCQIYFPFFYYSFFFPLDRFLFLPPLLSEH